MHGYTQRKALTNVETADMLVEVVDSNKEGVVIP